MKTICITAITIALSLMFFAAEAQTCCPKHKAKGIKSMEIRKMDVKATDGFHRSSGLVKTHTFSPKAKKHEKRSRHVADRRKLRKSRR